MLGAAMTVGMGSTLLACGRSKSRGTRASSAAAVAEGRPKEGGQLNRAEADDISTFDPATRLTIVKKVMTLTNDGLLNFKVGPRVKYNDYVITAGLAESWETPDAQTYTFHIRKGVRFADLPPLNGRPFTASDARWSIEYLSHSGDLKNLPKAPSTSMFEGLSSTETPDGSTLVARFAQPFAPFLSYIASVFTPMLAHEILDADGDFSKRTVGTGPWQLDSGASQKGSRWVFKKNPTYWDKGRPYIDQINWLIIPDDATANAAFQSKQIDMVDSGLSFDTTEQLKKAVPGVVVDAHRGLRGTFFYMNTSRAPLNDVRVRQAFALSIDRDEFVKTFTHGQGEWALASGLPDLFAQDEVRQILKDDPAQARSLVAEAGYQNGVDIEFAYPGASYGQESVSELELLQSQVKRGGINLSLKSVDKSIEGNLRRSGNYQMEESPHAAPFIVAGDLDAPLYGFYHPGSPTNFNRVNDPKLTALVEAQRHEVDRAKRRDLWRQGVRYINEVPWAQALVYEVDYALWHPYLKNYARNADDSGLSRGVVNAWLDK